MSNEFNVVRGMPYRLIPVDIGYKINDKNKYSIKCYLDKFTSVQLTNIKKDYFK